jgi:hypothetical protein
MSIAAAVVSNPKWLYSSTAGIVNPSIISAYGVRRRSCAPPAAGVLERREEREA